MMKVPKSLKWILAILVIVWLLGRMSRFEGYAPITIALGPRASAGPASLFDLPVKAECAASSAGQGDYYGSSAGPGGVCGGAAWVKAQHEDWTITSGIGGSLLP
jgi:hypothetical protein